ncbi:ribonuclease D [Halopseudomonas xinjiangensis]|uniref:Ribonuclease D n=1 Tax=Halopseudomonas xinjiangensis TaxID=487184 RepID=A0A1H1PVT7_9GAMM|nr:ribonuclease D [Halopseudomonas xinjiangensis]
MTANRARPLMIAENSELARWCERWQQLPFVAVDTEFVRTETFYPIAGLIQIGDGEAAYLIDPLAITDWSPLVALLRNPRVVKVLHSCSEDLEVFHHLCGAVPQPLFDTQLAAAYLGMDFSMGYSRLVNALLGIELSKDETRSDWLQRPLSETQLQYAADDAIHLAAIYQVLAPRIEEAGFTGWLLSDTAEQSAAVGLQQDPDLAYRSIKQAWRLRPDQLAILQLLAAWRERESRSRDQARNRLLRETAMVPLAQRQPESLQDLARIDDMHPRSVRHDGQQILDLIRQGKAVPQEQWPDRLPEPLPADANRVLKALRKVGQAHAVRLGIAPEIMLRKKFLEALVRTGYPGGPYELPDELSGWRRDLMGEQLLQVANGTQESNDVD